MMAESKPICSVQGCNKPRKYIKTGWCGAHYARWQANGSLELRPKEGPKVCSVEGCDKRANVAGAARGFCGKHYQRWKSNGDPLVSRIDRETPRDGCEIDGCDAAHHAGGFCHGHYYRLKKHGDPQHEWVGKIQRWLQDHKDYDGDDCLKWPFSVSAHGRGSVTVNGQTTTAPRAMCILAQGEPPTPQHHAAHSCGKGHEGCMNPRHLSWKLPAENEADKVIHGTLRRGRAINTNKLTEADVRAIRKSSEAGVTLAKRYDVTPAAISSIRKRRVWKWLE